MMRQEAVLPRRLVAQRCSNSALRLGRILRSPIECEWKQARQRRGGADDFRVVE
jgi:hypothetical protein